VKSKMAEMVPKTSRFGLVCNRNALLLLALGCFFVEAFSFSSHNNLNIISRTNPHFSVITMKSDISWIPKSLMPRDVYKSLTSERAKEMSERLNPLIFSENKEKASYFRYSLARIGFFVTVFNSGIRLALKSSPSLDPQVISSKIEAVLTVFEKEWGHIEAGVYKSPYDMQRGHRQNRADYVVRKMFQTAPQVAQIPGRREANNYLDLPFSPLSKIYPEYYMRNFHFQTDGWFSDKSAKAYEFSTEMLFSGCQDAMTRAALVPISKFVKESPLAESNLSYLEVGAGTGRFATFVRDNFPEMKATISDLSPFYLAEAVENEKYWRSFANPESTPASFVQANVEDLPFEDSSFDVLTIINVFHEMPPESRKRAVVEMMRVLKPGGIVVLSDSMQKGDRENGDIAATAFTKTYHEPYYESWFLNENLDILFGDAGFVLNGEKEVVFVSKVASYMKPSLVSTAEISEGQLVKMNAA